MCRFIAYLGNKEILLKSLIQDPGNSLIKQSRGAKEGTHHINADGFGIAWYQDNIDDLPAIYKTTQPAWNDNNLFHIISKIKSKCFLSHIRASTVGDVGQNNSHPFYYDKYSFVHNGTINGFDHIKLKLINLIGEKLFLQIKGNTDSECFFFLIIYYLQISGNKCLMSATTKAFNWIRSEQSLVDQHNSSRLNIVITDGEEMVAARCSINEDANLSLYYSSEEDGTIIASEPLDSVIGKWTEIPANHYFKISDNAQIQEIKHID